MMWLRLLAIFTFLKLVFVARVTEERNGKIPYDGYQLLKSDVRKELLDDLEAELGLDIWRPSSSFDNTSDIVVSPEDADTIKHRIKESGASYTIVISDISKTIEQENPPFEIIQDVATTRDHLMDWNHYHEYEDIRQYIDHLASRYSDLCTVIPIGFSSENRSLVVLKVSSKSDTHRKPGIWVDGGIHAREWISPASVTYVIQELVGNYDNNRDLVDKFDWYFLPIVNPDGYQYTFTNDRLWRKTRSGSPSERCKGVDPNRNFPYKWGGKGTSSNPCSQVYHGPKALSEPETNAMANFIAQNRGSLKVYITVHSYGQLILIPWGYAQGQYPEDYAEMKKVADIAANAIRDATGADFRTGHSANMLYAAAGGSDDWAKSVGIPLSYTFELRDTGKYGFLLPASEITISGKELFAAVQSIAKYLDP